MTRSIFAGNMIKFDDNRNDIVIPGLTVEALTDQVSAILQMVLSQTSDAVELRSSVGSVIASLTASGYFRAASGSAGSPGWSFYDDPDTGAYSSGTNSLSLSAAGSELVRIVLDAIMLGRGDGSASPQNITLRGPAAVGQNLVGSNITIDAPNGTGSGGSGLIKFRTAPTLSGTGIITHDADSTHAGLVNASSTLTWSHTVGAGQQRILIVTISHNNSASISSVTYGGAALTQLDTSINTNGVSGVAEIWYLLSPTVGTASIVVTASTPNLMSGGASSWFEVHQSTPFGTVAKATGSGTSASVSVTGATGDVIVDCLCKINSTEAPTSGQTLLYSVTTSNATVTSNRYNLSSQAAGAASVSMSYTWPTNSRIWAMLGAALKPGGNSAANTFADMVQIAPTYTQVGDIAGGNYAEFESDGTLVLNGNATGFKDELASLIASRLENPSSHIVQNNAEGSITFKTTCDLNDYIILNFQFNHDRYLTTNVGFHIHWWQTSSSVPNWLMEYRWQRNGQAKVTAWTRLARSGTNAFTYVSGTLNQITGFGSITPPASDGISDIFQVRLMRDVANTSGLFSGTDPVAGDVDAVFADVHKQINKPQGSRQEYTY